MTKGLLFSLLIFIGFLSSFTSCEQEGACDLGLCPGVFINAKLSIPDDTMYVGDSLIIEMTVPDQIFIVQEGDTIWEEVKRFEHLWGGYNFLLIDTTEADRLGNPETAPIVLVGGRESQFDIISSTPPYQNKVMFVLKKAGTYFLSTFPDAACKVNQTRRSLTIDFDVAEKHFEWLEPYIVPNGGTVAKLKQNDENDVKNYFPFRVLEK